MTSLLPRADRHLETNVCIGRPNYSSITAPPRTLVTFHHYHNIYTYEAWKLWLAYGIAIGLATIAVAIGLVVMRLNGASYSDNFSTILRASIGAHVNRHISVDIMDHHMNGKDPVPEYLEDALVHFQR